MTYDVYLHYNSDVENILHWFSFINTRSFIISLFYFYFFCLLCVKECYDCSLIELKKIFLKFFIEKDKQRWNGKPKRKAMQCFLFETKKWTKRFKAWQQLLKNSLEKTIQFTKPLWSPNKTAQVEYNIFKALEIHTERTAESFICHPPGWQIPPTSISDFEQVNVGWIIYLKVKSRICTFYKLKIIVSARWFIGRMPLFGRNSWRLKAVPQCVTKLHIGKIQ